MKFEIPNSKLQTSPDDGNAKLPNALLRWFGSLPFRRLGFVRDLELGVSYFATTALSAVVFALCLAPAHGDWNVLGPQWRPDANPWAKSQLWQGYIWSEGWSEKEQFWPKYMRPAGSVHVVLHNNSKSADTIELTHLDGVPIQDVVTKPDRIGRVVWYRVESPKLGPPKPVNRPDEEWKIVEPAKVEPGGWAECSIRFRSVPAKPVQLRFRSGSGGTVDVSVPVKPPRVRF
ncbi:MAG: hypothetical protein NTU88_14735, partial [Armatimonadetes bacterium]|nr:hypothetical protein [Armatimonadota bacterium]